MRKSVPAVQSGIFAKALQRRLLQKLDNYQIVISEHPDQTVQRCRTFPPDALRMKATGYLPWRLADRLEICRRVRRSIPACRLVILVDAVADHALAQQGKAARRDREIDAFLSGMGPEHDPAAVSDSL